MGVVEGMPVAGKGKPATWEDARAGFEPGELVRGRRSLTVEYRHHGDRWIATSPDLDGFEVSASTLPQLKTAAQAVLDGWLDPAVQVHTIEIDEAREPAKKPKRRTRPARWARAQSIGAVLRWRRTRPRPETADRRTPHRPG